MLLDLHNKSVGCDVSSRLLTAANADLFAALLSPVLNQKLYISESS